MVSDWVGSGCFSMVGFGSISSGSQTLYCAALCYGETILATGIKGMNKYRYQVSSIGNGINMIQSCYLNILLKGKNEGLQTEGLTYGHSLS